MEDTVFPRLYEHGLICEAAPRSIFEFLAHVLYVKNFIISGNKKAVTVL